VIYEHGEPCWNDSDMGKLLIRPPELTGFLPVEPSSSKAGETMKGKYEFLPYEISFSYFGGIFNMQ
jgi:hypothetical protein